MTRKADYVKLGEIVKSLKNEQNQLRHQIIELQPIFDVQKALINKTNFEKVEAKKREREVSKN